MILLKLLNPMERKVQLEESFQLPDLNWLQYQTILIFRKL